jgi:hypothetical protein
VSGLGSSAETVSLPDPPPRLSAPDPGWASPSGSTSSPTNPCASFSLSPNRFFSFQFVIISPFVFFLELNAAWEAWRATLGQWYAFHWAVHWSPCSSHREGTISRFELLFGTVRYILSWRSLFFCSMRLWRGWVEG